MYFLGDLEELWWVALDNWSPESLPCEWCLAKRLGEGEKGGNVKPAWDLAYVLLPPL